MLIFVVAYISTTIDLIFICLIQVSSIIGIFRNRADISTLVPDSHPLVDVRLFVSERGSVRVKIYPHDDQPIASPVLAVTPPTPPIVTAPSMPPPSKFDMPETVNFPKSHALELSLCGLFLDGEENSAKLERFRYVWC